MKACVELSEKQFEALEFDVLTTKATQLGKRGAHEWLYNGPVGERS